MRVGRIEIFQTNDIAIVYDFLTLRLLSVNLNTSEGNNNNLVSM